MPSTREDTKSDTKLKPVPKTEAVANRGAERVTVNLGRRAAAALERVADDSGDTKTDIINKALQLYALVQDVQNSGGAIWIQDDEESQLARARFY
jgi:hypothetical protein